MGDSIIIEQSVFVYKAARSPLLGQLSKKVPLLEKLLMRLPQKWIERLYRDEFRVTERVMEKGFVFMSLAGLPKAGKVLDVGCSWSILPLELGAMGYKVWGIDVLDYRLEHPNLTFIRGDACALPFEDGFFDAVTAVSTVEHIGLGWYGDPAQEGGDKKAVREMLRVLKPGGLLVLTVPYGVSSQNRIFRVYDAAALSALTAGFKKLKEEYFINLNDKVWVLSDAAAAGRCGVNERTRNEGNACLALQK